MSGEEKGKDEVKRENGDKENEQKEDGRQPFLGQDPMKVYRDKGTSGRDSPAPHVSSLAWPSDN